MILIRKQISVLKTWTTSGVIKKKEMLLDHYDFFINPKLIA